MAIFLLLSALSHAQIKNANTENIKIYGSCAMCKNTIEHAGNQKNTVALSWDKNTQIASVTYDSKKTNTDQILKRIALAGYDNSSFLAPESAYTKLPECCKYIREAKASEPKSEKNFIVDNPEPKTVQKGSLQEINTSYFTLKDAFVKSDIAAVSANAKVVLNAISSMKTASLSSEENKIWIKIYPVLTNELNAILIAKSIEKQRDSFKEVSKKMYELIKISKPTEPVYYQYCPMANASWLSQESTIKNPYYGAQMLNCGSTVETIQ